MRKLLAASVIVAALAMIAGSVALVVRTQRDGEYVLAESKALHHVHAAILKRDYARLHAEAAPALRASTSPDDIAARFAAFEKAHGAPTGGFKFGTQSRFRFGTEGIGFDRTTKFSFDFERAPDVPLEADFEWDGDRLRPTRIALRTPNDPLVLGAAP